MNPFATWKVAIANPQMGRSNEQLEGVWACVACGSEIEAGATYRYVFSGLACRPKVFAIAHEQRVSEDMGLGGSPTTACGAVLDRIHRHLLDSAGIMQYLRTEDGPALWRRGRLADPTADPQTFGAHNGHVLLADGQWAVARHLPSGRLELGYGTSGPVWRLGWARIDPPAWFHPGTGWPSDGESHGSPGPIVFGNPQRVGEDGGPFRWHWDSLLGQPEVVPLLAGDVVQVSLAGCRTPAQFQTNDDGREASVVVPLAGGSKVTIPAPGLELAIDGDSYPPP